MTADPRPPRDGCRCAKCQPPQPPPPKDPLLRYAASSPRDGEPAPPPASLNGEWCVEAFHRVNPGAHHTPYRTVPSLYLLDFAREVLRTFAPPPAPSVSVAPPAPNPAHRRVTINGREFTFARTELTYEYLMEFATEYEVIPRRYDDGALWTVVVHLDGSGRSLRPKSRCEIRDGMFIDIADTSRA